MDTRPSDRASKAEDKRHARHAILSYQCRVHTRIQMTGMVGAEYEECLISYERWKALFL